MLMRNLAAVAAVALSAGALHAQATTKSVWEGIYAPEQADRGQAQYTQRCAACHGVTLGGTGEAPALTGGEFVSHYDQLSVGDLFERVRTTMPQNDPGTLTRDQYADVVAFLLKSNGFPAGSTPLDRRTEVLATIGIQAQKPAAAQSGK
ncbi:mono/diheme cytochrome c family protein [Polymorphobacter fuscus]|nr:mono/diheme cytochrome c family protein [Polymorphobacter fuscus]